MLCSPSLRCPKFYARYHSQNFDRCTIPASLYPPQAALRRQCPKQARYQLRYTPKYLIVSALCFGGKALIIIFDFYRIVKKRNSEIFEMQSPFRLMLAVAAFDIYAVFGYNSLLLILIFRRRLWILKRAGRLLSAIWADVLK